ncbi:uncharacterized protein MONOS_17108 [Monocercomonoides exilis]|uniref:uncharacterized protein n=1 Tax=Monocercomonoides exilis TaxID=2049356 RepID=UPI003559635C|nr:hypothetical protein MONOS_17108 [Monocercomonoides exilis]
MMIIQLCRCYIILYDLHSDIPIEYLSKIFSYLLEIASRKKESDEFKKQVEMSLEVISFIDYHVTFGKEQYLDEIKGIIQYHQMHRKLTQLAYQSAWLFLLNRAVTERELKDVIVNELHFVEEATRELEELTECVNWKKKEKETDELKILEGWNKALDRYIYNCRIFVEGKNLNLMTAIVKLCEASKTNHV